MSRTTAHVTISLDGVMAGPAQAPDLPLGVGGEALHRWMFEPANDGDRAMRDRLGRQNAPESARPPGTCSPGLGSGTRTGAAGGARSRRTTRVEAVDEVERRPPRTPGRARRLATRTGGGVRPLEGLPDGVGFEPVEVVASPLATHVVYRVTR